MDRCNTVDQQGEFLGVKFVSKITAWAHWWWGHSKIFRDSKHWKDNVLPPHVVLKKGYLNYEVIWRKFNQVLLSPWLLLNTHTHQIFSNVFFYIIDVPTLLLSQSPNTNPAVCPLKLAGNLNGLFNLDSLQAHLEHSSLHQLSRAG